MSEQACRIRQKNNPYDIGCRDCEQGKEIMARYDKARANLAEREAKANKKNNPCPAKKKRGRPPKNKKVELPSEEEIYRQAVKRYEKCLVLNFKDHPDLYAQVNEAASSDLRTPENQVLFILKNNFL